MLQKKKKETTRGNVRRKKDGDILVVVSLPCIQWVPIARCSNVRTLSTKGRPDHRHRSPPGQNRPLLG
ncbi:Hypothetical predicted protein [Octopus vulgaris]|uniref:Uncharacterized protein n=1 Tax=Octopus vulgaris TaxID=6645 RepID=A0AA36C2D5_OCTVU|nr:Hypothetical predicted protein [Octopus vulgaris]